MSSQITKQAWDELLRGGNSGRLDYFQKRRISHPALIEIKDRLCGIISLRAGVDLAIVAGPTGVGKSTLKSVIRDQVARGEIEELKSDPGFVPLITVEATSPEVPVFGWKDFYTRILEAVEEPLIEKKIPDVQELHPAKVSVRNRSLSTAELRRVTEKCLRYRKTNVLIVDEAHHMLRGSTSRVMDSLETLKSFASHGSVFVVLIGTYDLTSALELNGQLGRRTKLLNFARYHPVEGLEGFLVALKGFQDRLPFQEAANLISHAGYLYETSLGLVGVLKNHLERALKLALDENAQTITLMHLRASALPAKARLKIAREIRRGEEFFEGEADAEREARQILGIPENLPAHEAERAEPRLKSPRGVGERQPRRDPIGIQAEAA